VIRRCPSQNATLVEVTIPTGRSQQIRIHLSHAGFPLVGDPLYQVGGIPRAPGAGGEISARPGEVGYFLHSWKIRFPHPARGEDVEVVCPPPPVLDPASRDATTAPVSGN
jgi:23S rRNA pseudouridine1911/1915/1917 synthase